MVPSNRMTTGAQKPVSPVTLSTTVALERNDDGTGEKRIVSVRRDRTSASVLTFVTHRSEWHPPARFLRPCADVAPLGTTHRRILGRR